LKVTITQTDICGHHPLHGCILIKDMANHCFSKQAGEMEGPTAVNSAFEPLNSNPWCFNQTC
jgi:hypothetical protein